MSIKKFGILLVVIALLWSLDGTSLAKESAGTEETLMNKDHLVGVFVTTEHIDLFDMEGYLNDHVGDLVNGGTINVENSSKYEGRLYATVTGMESKDPSDWEVSFGAYEGICFFHAEWKQEGKEPFSMLSLGDEICDVMQNLSMTDEGEYISLTGTMYALIRPNTESISFYMNPVYQTETGEIYLLSGNSHTLSGAIGGKMTTKLEEKVNETQGEEYGASVELSIEIFDTVPEQVFIHYMGEDLQILHTESYAAGEVPSSLRMKEGTVCVVAETKWSDGTSTRALYELNEEGKASIELFYKVSDTALGKQVVEVLLTF